MLAYRWAPTRSNVTQVSTVNWAEERVILESSRLYIREARTRRTSLVKRTTRRARSAEGSGASSPIPSVAVEMSKYAGRKSVAASSRNHDFKYRLAIFRGDVTQRVSPAMSKFWFSTAMKNCRIISNKKTRSMARFAMKYGSLQAAAPTVVSTKPASNGLMLNVYKRATEDGKSQKARNADLPGVITQRGGCFFVCSVCAISALIFALSA